MLVGFTAVAYHIGRLLQDKVDALRTRPYAATFTGILLIVSPVLLARLVGLTGGLGFFVWPIAAVGFLLEYTRCGLPGSVPRRSCDSTGPRRRRRW